MNIPLWFPTGTPAQVEESENTSHSQLNKINCSPYKTIIFLFILGISGQEVNPESMNLAVELFHELIENTPQSKTHKQRSWPSVGDFIKSEVQLTNKGKRSLCVSFYLFIYFLKEAKEGLFRQSDNFCLSCRYEGEHQRGGKIKIRALGSCCWVPSVPC